MSRKTTFSRALTYDVIYSWLENLALNMFKWTNLPKGMRPEYIEYLLYNYGHAVFFKDKNQGLLCLRAEPQGGLNVYGEWVQIRPAGINGIVFDVYNNHVDCVWVRNNPRFRPTMETIEWFTRKLVEVECSLDHNTKMQKFPFFVAADDKNILTLKTIIKKVEDDEIAVYADKSMKGNIEILQTGVPIVLTELADYRNDVWNQVRTFLGINNANTDKKERLITNEVDANNDQIKLNADYMLQARQIAVEEINEIFGTNIGVELREVEQNGAVHPGTSATSGE